MNSKTVKRTVTKTPWRKDNKPVFQRPGKAATVVKQAFAKLLRFGAVQLVMGRIVAQMLSIINWTHKVIGKNGLFGGRLFLCISDDFGLASS